MTGKLATPNRKGSAGLIFTVIFFFSMLLLYIGERLILESPVIRISLGVMSLVGIALAIAGRLQRRKHLPTQASGVESQILWLYLLGTAALLLYALQADFMMDRLRTAFSDPKAADRFQGALTALWPVVWLCSALPLVFVELSYAPMDVTRTMERGRIQRSWRSGMLVAMTACLLFVINFIVSEYNKKVDLTYFKTTRPSDSSHAMVQNLSEKVEVYLFFPGTNEVLDQARGYFDGLDGASKHFSVKQTDQVLEPVLAKKLSVSRNGTVVLRRGTQHQQIRLAVKLEQAKRKLKNLDQEFQKAFRKLMVPQRIAYLTVGHEERSKTPRDNVKGSSIRKAKEWLERLNFMAKNLGVSEGLASEVPPDATVVILFGPRKDLLPAEVDALHRYLDRGGKMLVFLDPEAELSHDGLLNPYGLKFTPERLANDKLFVRLTRTTADRSVIFSNRFSSHPSVTTLSRYSSRLVTILRDSGYLEEIPPRSGTKPQVQFTVHSMPFTWNDRNSNRAFDKGEKRKVYELAAAVVKKVQRPSSKGNKGKNQMRMLVVADSDIVSDAIFRNKGNKHFFLDAIKWLAGEEAIMGKSESEEDSQIVRTRKEDQLWFYLTIFAVPALVLGLGLFYTRRIRRRR